MDAETRVAVRCLGTPGGDTAFIPPNNKAFETGMLLYAHDGIAMLRSPGPIGAENIGLACRDRAAIVAATEGGF